MAQGACVQFAFGGQVGRNSLVCSAVRGMDGGMDDGVRSSGAKLWLQGSLREAFGSMEATLAELEVRGGHNIGCLRSTDGGLRSTI